MKNNIKILFFLLIIVSISACNNSNPVPKPTGYFRIDLPEKEYKLYNDDCPFTFEMPVYSFIIKGKEEQCWMDLYFPGYNATIYCTYKKVNNDLNAHLEDSREFVYKHVVKADAIEETRYENDTLRVFGIFYNLKGNTATSVQFFVTDSTNHFFRGSLYFNAPPNKDSLAPVVEFIKEDIAHLIESFRWK
jgi:gliding motility-associated lipoprotein GldD